MDSTAFDTEYRTLASDLYELSQERRRLERALSEPLKALFRNLPHGFAHFTIAALSAPGTRYLLIDTRGPNATYANEDRLSCKTYRIVRVAGEPDACAEDEQTGEIAGRICADAFGWANAEPNLPKPWRVLSHASPDGRCILIPLAGDVLMQHAPLRRIANYGRKIAAGAALELAAIEELDARVSHMQKRQRQVQADALAAATAGFDTPALERQHAVIVRMMKAHDWTWREADRFYHHCADHEDRMLAALAEIPEAAAAGLWHLHAPVSYWS